MDVSGQNGFVVWLTGFPGSGKTTTAMALKATLERNGRQVCVLDGDAVRVGLNRDLKFKPGDRDENVRRVAEVAALVADNGIACVVSLISPMRSQRASARALVGEERFLEVHVDAPLSVCEARDPKGLYRRARAGEIKNLTGVGAPYEPPADPDLRLNSVGNTVDDNVDDIVSRLFDLGLISAGGQP